jgi:c-di-GMP-binding flagellar brake protein YcgR
VEQSPEINDPVVLRDQADREYASQVQNLGRGLVVVAQPPDLPADEEFPNGTELRVAWVDADDVVMELPTRILAAHAADQVQLWSLVVTGPASIAQRRRVERVGVSGPVALRPPEGSDFREVPGTLVDASEKAIRCSVAAGSADRLLGDRNEVVAAFRLGTADFAIPGRVEFARGTKRPTELEELVVLFDEPVADADALRKQVFAQEVRTPPTGDEGDRS